MATKPEKYDEVSQKLAVKIADEIIKIYFTCGDLTEFKYAMKYKLDIYPGDIELLWYIIDRAWGAGNDDESH